MPSKKKPRPLFEVPIEIDSARESGWVYRSEAEPSEPGPSRKPEARPVFETGVVAASAQVFALAMATAEATFMLSVSLAALPLTMSLRVLDSINGDS